MKSSISSVLDEFEFADDPKTSKPITKESKPKTGLDSILDDFQFADESTPQVQPKRGVLDTVKDTLSSTFQTEDAKSAANYLLKQKGYGPEDIAHAKPLPARMERTQAADQYARTGTMPGPRDVLDQFKAPQINELLTPQGRAGVVASAQSAQRLLAGVPEPVADGLQDTSRTVDAVGRTVTPGNNERTIRELMRPQIEAGIPLEAARERVTGIMRQRESRIAMGEPEDAVNEWASELLGTPMATVRQGEPETQAEIDAKAFRGKSTEARGVAKGVNALKQQALGGNQWLADQLGADEYSAAMSEGRKELQKFSSILGERDGYMNNAWENSVSSFVSNAPSLVYGVAGAGKKAFGLMYAQVFGDEYARGTENNLERSDAGTRAGIMASAEVIGESLGFGRLVKFWRGAARGVPTDELAKHFGKHVLGEIPGEQLTAAMQFGTDKYADFGLNKNATAEDYANSARDTLVQTVMQAGIHAAGGTAVKGIAEAGKRREDRDTELANIGATEAKQSALSKLDAFLPKAQPRQEAGKPVEQAKPKSNIESILDDFNFADDKQTTDDSNKNAIEATKLLDMIESDAAITPESAQTPESLPPSQEAIPSESRPNPDVIPPAAKQVESIKPQEQQNAAQATPPAEPLQSTPAQAQEAAPVLGEQVSLFAGRYGKGMNRSPAIIEAKRLNHQNTDPSIRYVAEEHGNPSLENPWAVVGRSIENQTVSGTETTDIAVPVGSDTPNAPIQQPAPRQPRTLPISDVRLKDASISQELTRMASEAGWETQGGQLLRDAEGNATGRTSWTPRAPWYADLPEKLGTNATIAAVNKAIASEPMTAKEKRVVLSMLDMAQEHVKPVEPDAIDLENQAEREAIMAEASADVSALDDDAFNALIDATFNTEPTKGALTNEEIDIALGLASPPEISGIAQETDAQGTDEGNRGRGPQARNVGGQEAEEFSLTGQTNSQILAEEAKAKKEAEAQAQRDAVPAAEEFILTGSNRQADIADAHGQVDLTDVVAQSDAKVDNQVDNKPAQGNEPAPSLTKPEAKASQQEPQSQEPEQPFDSDAFNKSREDIISESKAAGNRHLDNVRPSVETMRGKTIYYAHNPKQRGVIRTVDNRGNVYIYWADKYSAQKELASEVEETNKAWLKSSKNLPYMRDTRDGKTFVFQSSLGQSDLKDYVFDDGAAVEKAAEPQSEVDKAKAALDAAGVTGADRTRTIADVRRGDLTAEDVQEAHPVSEKGANAPIEDFGVKLEGARKDMETALKKEFSDDDLASLPLSKIWPADLSEKIEDSFIAAFMFTARSYIPSKPRKPYAVKRWVEQVKMLRRVADTMMSNPEMRGKAEALLNENAALQGFLSKVSLLEAIDRTLWKRIGNVGEYPDAYRFDEGGNKVAAPTVKVEIDARTQYFQGASSVADVVELVNEKLGAPAQDKKMQFEVRGTDAKGYAINKKGDGEYRKLKTFATAKEALDYRNSNYAELVAAWEDVKNRDNVKKDDVRGSENKPRTGKDHRQGKDVSVEQFSNAFGFRGGQFGNWVKQGNNAKDRQWMLNSAYDALMDLSDILGIPPKAISLNGDLGISFGARGHGSASAHYESDTLVINLTKTRGAGTLAHEWFHALDNYFQRNRNAPMDHTRETRYITYRPEPLYVHKSGRSKMTKYALEQRRKENPNSAFYDAANWRVDPDHPSGVRAEVEAKFSDLVNALNDSPMKERAAVVDGGKLDGYWSRIIERAARSFENYIIAKMAEKGYHNDYLANVVDISEFSRNPERYPYLKDEELAPVVEAFDNLFGELETKETDQGTALFSRAGQRDREIPSKVGMSSISGEEINVENAETPQGNASAWMRHNLQGRSFTNEHTGWDIGIGRKGINKTLSHAAKTEHAQSVAALPQLLKNAVLVATENNKDEAQRVDVPLVHHFYAPLSIGNQTFIARLVVNETRAGEKFYDHDLSEELGPDQLLADAHLPKEGAANNLTGPFVSIGTLMRFVKAAHGGSTPLFKQDSRRANILDAAEGPTAEPELTLVSAQAIIDTVNGGVTTKLKGGINLVWMTDDLPSYLGKVPSDVLGLYQPETDAIWMVMENHDSAGEFMFTLAHELFGHAGMGKQMGKALHPILNDIWLRNGTVRTAANKMMRQYGYDRFTAVEEVLADMAASGEAPKLNGWQKLLAKIVDYLTGLFPGKTWSEGEVLELVAGAGRYIRTGEGKLDAAAQDDIVSKYSRAIRQTDTEAFKNWFGDSKVVDAEGNPLVVYHGTSSDITEFDASKTSQVDGIFLTPEKDYANAFARGRQSGGNVIPLYATINNPRYINADNYNFNSLDAALSDAKHDGVIVLNDDGTIHVVVAREATQIKSAIGNNGNFDHKNPDIRYSRKGQSQLPLSTNQTPAPPTNIPEETTVQKSQRVVQDQFNRFKVLQDWLKEHGVSLSDKADVYLAETLMSGRISIRKQDFRENQMAPLIEKTQAAGVSMEQVGYYLKAKHAPEANVRARDLHGNPDATAYGMSDQDAKDEMDTFKALPNFAELKAIAGEWQAITGQSKKILLDAGILSDEQVAAWGALYSDYVPVKGLDDKPGSGTGKGLNVNGRQKQRLGHGLRDEGIIENILRDHERAISLDEKNRVGHALIRFALEAKNPDIVTVAKPVRRQVLQKGQTSYIVTYQGADVAVFDTNADAAVYITQEALRGRTKSDFAIAKTSDPVRVMLQASPMLADNEVNVYVAGHAVRVQINDEIAARAYTRMGVEHLNVILSAGREINNWLSKVYTGYSPDFIFTNPLRDAIQGSITLTGEHGVGMAAKIFANYPMAVKELAKHFRKAGSSAIVTDYRANGGSTGAAYLSDLERIGDDIQAAYNEHAGMLDTYHRTYDQAINAGKSVTNARSTATMKSGVAKLRRIPLIGHVLRLMERINSVTENALRVATYHTLVQEGVTKPRAAAQAKNLMNFNRKGEIANQAGALYLFFNPSVQGAQVMHQALFESKHKNQARALAGTMVLSAIILAEMAMMGGDDDEDKWNNTYDHVKDGNMVFQFDDFQLTITLPYGYRVFHTLGNVISDFAHGTKDGYQLGIRMANSVFANFSPVGNPMEGEHFPFQVLPTTAKMLLGPSVNEDSYGRPIGPTRYSDAKPDSQMLHRATKGSVYADVAEGMNSITGGSKYEKGMIDVSPETLKYWVRSLTGGAGQFAVDTVSITIMGAQGVAPQSPKDVPIMRRFVREIGVSDTRSAFWDRAKEAKKAAEEFSAAKRSHDRSAMRDILDEKGPLIKLSKYAERQQEMIKAMRDETDRIKVDDSLTLKQKIAKMKMIEMQESAVYSRFIKAFDEAK